MEWNGEVVLLGRGEVAQSLPSEVVNHRMGLLLTHVIPRNHQVELGESLLSDHCIHQLHKAFLRGRGANAHLEKGKGKGSLYAAEIESIPTLSEGSAIAASISSSTPGLAVATCSMISL